jgi:hypothetical protein
MYKKFRNYLDLRPRTRVIVGWTFVVLGFLAAVLPLVPGVILLIIGLEVLGIRLLFVKNILEKVRAKKTTTKTGVENNAV